MILSKKNKQDLLTTTNSTDIPGIIKDARGVAYTTDNLTASSHFFSADSFKIKKRRDIVSILFGQTSNFESSESYRLAVEIEIPIIEAVNFLYVTIWEKGYSFEDNPFGEVVKNFCLHNSTLYEENLDSSESSGKNQLALPENPTCYRKFNSNFITCSLSDFQAMIEFFMVPPDLKVSLKKGKSTRPHAGVKQIISILMSPYLMNCLFGEVKGLLEQHKNLRTISGALEDN